ncbi:hypothetical protein [Catenulispora subtropica]|uniref:MDMPI C-terminal domain-containing protein n=1 Tax=Catenulispora subtropica TaxID=450798 RepID=A0ABN2SGZ4_9ACTN
MDSGSVRTSTLGESHATWRSVLLGRLRTPRTDHRVYLRGGPVLLEPRLSAPPAATSTEVQVPVAGGGTAWFRISGDYELVEGRPRRVFEYVGGEAAS